MKIVLAQEQHLSDVNQLIVRSKSHWEWPPDYLAAALPLLRITPFYLHANACFELRESQTLIGFLSLTEGADGPMLDNLWIEPNHIGNGFGRMACDYAFDFARRSGWIDLSVLPDPPAERFYVRMGFRDTGQRVRSRVTNGPVFTLLKKQLTTARVEVRG